MNNLLANVRKIIAPGIVCMLLFVTVSCENSNELFDDADIFTGEFFSEDVFTRGFIVSHTNCGWILDGNVTLSYAGPGGPWFVPVNLPEEYQREQLLVDVTFREHTMEGRKCNFPAVKIVTIEEAISTSIFIVRQFDNCGWLLFEDLGDDDVLVVAPTYLSEEFQQDGLRVQVTSHRSWRHPIVECEGIVAIPVTIRSIMMASEREEDAQTRITDGTQVNINTTPWQVLFAGHNGVQWMREHCGGAIIAPNFILTARHCIDIRSPHFPFNWIRLQPNTMQIHAGITCKREINNNNTFNVAEIIPHPDPNIDAMLLRLSRDIPLNSITTRSINYLASLNNTFYNVGNRVRTSGWGMTRAYDPASYAECLQAVELSIISNQAAMNAFRSVGITREVHPHEVAATGTRIIGGRQGACHADSGGALTTQSASGEPVHIGIVAWGRGGCGGTNQNSPSVFVRTSHVASWIIRYVPPVITGATACCPGATATFSIPTLPSNASVRWIPGNFLAVTGANNQSTVTVRHTGVPAGVVPNAISRITAEISVNGQVRHTVHRDVVVNRPVITSLEAFPMTNAGNQTPFLVFHDTPYMQAHHTWSVTPSQNVFMVPWAQLHPAHHDNSMSIKFMVAGNYTVTATVSNACGASARSAGISVTGTSPPWCPNCGFFPVNPHQSCPACVPVWWGSEEEKEEEELQE